LAGDDILGARVSRTGQLLDPTAIPISTAPGDQNELSIARNGDHVLVAWEDRRQDPDGDIHGARVSRSGIVLDPDGIALATGPGLHWRPDLVSGPGHVLVTLMGFRGEACCPAQAVRVDSSGTVLDPTPWLVSQQSNSQFGPRIAFDGTNHLVVWSDDRPDGGGFQIHAARVAPNGVSLDPAGFLVGDAGSGNLADIAFDGTNFVIVWDAYDGEDYDVLAAIVSPDGQLLTPTPIPIVTTPGTFEYQAQLSPDGTNTMVVWTGADGIRAARLSPSGDVLDPGGVAVTAPGERGGFPSIAFDGTNHLVAYARFSESGVTDIVARRISAGGDVLDDTALPIDDTPNDAVFPDVAWSGTCYLVVWTTQTFDPNARRIEAARVGTDGSVLAPGPVRVSSTEDEQEMPRVAAADGWFLVTWTRPRPDASVSEVAAARIHETGWMPDPAGFLVAERGAAPDVVAGADGLLAVTYQRSVGPPTAAERVFLRTVAPK
jgi:hypothetical protein